MTAVTDRPALPLTGPDGGPLRWSHSAADKAARCPLEWAHRNGPLRPDQGDTEGPVRILAVEQRRGLVVHDAIAAGLQAAAADGADGGMLLAHYWPVVRRALGVAWDEHAMPASHAEAEHVTAMAEYVCSVVRVPRARDVIAIEDERDTTTPAGRPFRYIIDFARWVGPRVRITDWKTGAQDPDKTVRSPQLARYAWFLARDLDIDLSRIDVELHNVNKRRTAVVAVDVAFAERTVRHIDSLAAAMEAQAARGWFDGRPGPTCAGCDVRRTCPALAGRPVPEAGP